MTEKQKCKELVNQNLLSWLRDKECYDTVVNMIVNEIWEGCKNYEELIFYAKYIEMHEGE